MKTIRIDAAARFSFSLELLSKTRLSFKVNGGSRQVLSFSENGRKY